MSALPRLALPALALTALVGCLEYRTTIWRFDLKRGTGELILQDIGTSSLTGEPSDAAQRGDDFRELVDGYLRGDEMQLPVGLTVVDRALEEVDGRLDGRVTFTIDEPAAVFRITGDRRAWWRFCPEEGRRFASTNGTFDDEGCAVWPRRARRLEVVALEADAIDSLAPEHRAWVEAGRP